MISAVPKRLEHSLRHLTPIIQARRQEREQKGHEKPVGAIHSSNILTKIGVALAWFSNVAHGRSEGGWSHRPQLDSTYLDGKLCSCPYLFKGEWFFFSDFCIVKTFFFVGFFARVLLPGYLPGVHATSSGGSRGGSQVWGLDQSRTWPNA